MVPVNRATGLPIGVEPAQVPQDMQELCEQVHGLTIQSERELAIASDLLIKAKRKKKELEVEKKSKREPLNKQLDEITELYRIPLLLTDNMVAVLDAGVCEYHARKEEETRRANEKALAQFERKQARVLDAAEQKGEPPKAVALPTMQAPPAPMIRTGAGSLSVYDETIWSIPGVAEDDLKKLRRSDPLAAALPNDAFILDTAWVDKKVKDGAEVTGIVLSKRKRTTARR